MIRALCCCLSDSGRCSSSCARIIQSRSARPAAALTRASNSGRRSAAAVTSVAGTAERDMTALPRRAAAQVPRVHLILASATLRDALERDVDHPWAGRHGWPLIEPVRRVLQIPFPGGGVVRVNEAPGIVDSWGYPPESLGVTGPGYWSSAGTLAELQGPTGR